MAINSDMDAQRLHADREEVWADVLDWFQRQTATEEGLVDFAAMYDRLQLEGPDLRRAFMAMSEGELDSVSRLATAALCEAAHRANCAGGDDDGER